MNTENKLVSMVDKVFEQIEINSFDEDKMEHIWKYAKFLKRKLELGFFVPTSLDGVVLEKPNCWIIYNSQRMECSADEMIRCREYQEALDRVLFNTECIDISDGVFKGLKFKGDSLKMVEYNLTTQRFFYGLKTIEDLTEGYNLTLSPNAVKNLGL